MSILYVALKKQIFVQLIFLYCFSVFNFIDLFSYLYYPLSFTCFEFIQNFFYITDLRLFPFLCNIYYYKFPSEQCFRYHQEILICGIFIFVVLNVPTGFSFSFLFDLCIIYLENCLVSKCLDIFCHGYLLWFPFGQVNILCMISVLLINWGFFNGPQFGLSWYMFHGHLTGRCILSWVKCPIDVDENLSVDVIVQCISVFTVFLSSCSISWERGVEVPKYNFQCIYISFQFYQVFLHVFWSSII